MAQASEHSAKLRAPSPEEGSRLLGKSRTGLGLGLGVSLFAHVAVFGGAWLYASYTPPRVVPEKPIVAKLVRLGKPRDEKLLPRLPSAAQPPPASAKSVPTPTPTPATPPPVAPSPTAKSEPAPPKPNPQAEARARQQALLDALARVTPPPGATAAKAEELPGQEDGDPFGTADDAAEGDRYLALVDQAIRRNYVLPTTISQKERLYLKCVLSMKISSSGKIEAFRILESSGNAQFDRAVEASLSRTTLPPPPEAFRRLYKDGLEIVFKP